MVLFATLVVLTSAIDDASLLQFKSTKVEEVDSESAFPKGGAPGPLKRSGGSADLTKSQMKAGDAAAAYASIKGMGLALSASYCNQDQYMRGIGVLPWCKRGYHFVPHTLSCWEDCPHGKKCSAHAVWEPCQEPYPKSSSKTCWHKDCNTPWCPMKRPQRYRDQKWGFVGNWAVSACPPGKVQQTGLCYDEPDPGYTCNAMNCYSLCTGGLGEEVGLPEHCLLGCATDFDACAGDILNKVGAIAQSVVYTGILVASGGASAALSTASKTAMAAAAKAGAKMAAMKVKKIAFKELAKKLRKQIVEKVLRKVKDDLKGAGQAFAAQKLSEYVYQTSDELSTRLEAKILQPNWADGVAGAVLEFDPTGLATAIEASANENKSANAKAGAWMSFAGNFDPTGILSAASAFVSQDLCSVVHAQQQKEIDSSEGDVLMVTTVEKELAWSHYAKPCAKPAGFCQGAGDSYTGDHDCDEDGHKDPYCFDDTKGKHWIIRSGEEGCPIEKNGKCEARCTVNATDWCSTAHNSGFKYRDVDCDSDGLPDPFCFHADGVMKFLSSDHGCKENGEIDEIDTCDPVCPKPKSIFNEIEQDGCSGATFKMIDCDADGVPDPFCYSKTGKSWMALSSSKRGKGSMCDIVRGHCHGVCARPLLEGKVITTTAPQVQDNMFFVPHKEKRVESTDWCSGKDDEYFFEDCDLDGIPDHACKSSNVITIISPGNDCEEQQVKRCGRGDWDQVTANLENAPWLRDQNGAQHKPATGPRFR